MQWLPELIMLFVWPVLVMYIEHKKTQNIDLLQLSVLTLHNHSVLLLDSGCVSVYV